MKTDEICDELWLGTELYCSYDLQDGLLKVNLHS